VLLKNVQAIQRQIFVMTVPKLTQCVPLATEPDIFYYFTTNEDIATKSEADLPHTTNTFLFISHTMNALLFKFRCNIFISVRIIKEMPTKAQLFHKLPHSYVFRYYRVILRELVINNLRSYTSISMQLLV
jgi:hypothetical protein